MKVKGVQVTLLTSSLLPSAEVITIYILFASKIASLMANDFLRLWYSHTPRNALSLPLLSVSLFTRVIWHLLTAALCLDCFVLVDKVTLTLDGSGLIALYSNALFSLRLHSLLKHICFYSFVRWLFLFHWFLEQQRARENTFTRYYSDHAKWTLYW